MELTPEMRIQFTKLETIMNISDEPLQKELQSIIHILKREIEQAVYIINLQYTDTIDEEYLQKTLTKIQEETQQTTYHIQPTKIIPCPSELNLNKHRYTPIQQWRR